MAVTLAETMRAGERGFPIEEPMESISTEPAELSSSIGLVRVLAGRSRSLSGQPGRKRTRMKAASEGAVSRECIKLKEAAEYLECSQGTLENWISARKFTTADGLRRVGG